MGNEQSWTVGRVLDWTKGYFEGKPIDSPRLDAELIISAATGMSRTQLYMGMNKPLNADELAAIRERVRRRAELEPVAYITGERGFWSIDLKVDPRVLIPRPDTERLVELALMWLEGREKPTVVDVGTGSGCIALSLAKDRPDAQITAIDISPDALTVARENGAALGLGHVTFVEGDLLTPIDGPVDCIVSNPPYIPTGDIAGLMADVVRYEPRGALDGGPDGLDLIRTLVAQAKERIKPGGALFFEIGHDQGLTAPAVIEEIGGFTNVAVHRDYGKKDRVVQAIRQA